MSKPKSVQAFLAVNAGLALSALGIHIFRAPNHFALGGVSGAAMLLTAVLPFVGLGALMTALNLLTLALALLFLGRKEALKSVYGSLVLSGMLWLLEIVMPVTAPLTNQKLLELAYGVVIPGLGSALVFHYGATTGGTDILAKILSKHLKLKMSICLLLADFGIALAAGLTFGAEACLLSVFGVCLKSFVIDGVLESIRVKKIVVIISRASADIQSYICNELYRGATVHTARGAYTVEQKEVITTVLDRRQAALLRGYVQAVDPEAFITISNSSLIVGRGFSRGE